MIRKLTLEKFIKFMTNGFVICFGSWTIFVHILVGLGLTFEWLLKLAPAWMAVCSLALFLTFRLQDIGDHEPKASKTRKEFSVSSRLLWLFLSMILVTYFVLTKNYLVYWALSISLMVAAYFRLISQNTFELPPPSAPNSLNKLFFIVVAGICIAATLFIHRPDADDSIYVNLVTGLLDYPSLPMLATDTLHSIPGAPIHLPAYRVHSMEV